MLMRLFGASVLGTALIVLVSGCTQTFGEKVVRAGEGKLTVSSLHNDETKTHDVAPDAKITRDGQPAILEDLKAGDIVSLRTKMEGETSVAVEIDATSAEESEWPLEDKPATIPGNDTVPLPADPPMPTEELPLMGDGEKHEPIIEDESAVPTDDETAPPIEDDDSGVHSPDGEAVSDQEAFADPEDGAPAEADNESALVPLTYTGKVTSVVAAENQLVLMIGTESHSFFVADDARIVIDGAEAALDDLDAGFMATIEAERSGDQLIAKSINAMMER